MMQPINKHMISLSSLSVIKLLALCHYVGTQIWVHCSYFQFHFVIEVYKPLIPTPRVLLHSIQATVQLAHPTIALCLMHVHILLNCAVQKCHLHIKLAEPQPLWSSNCKHSKNCGSAYHRAEGLFIINACLLHMSFRDQASTKLLSQTISI